MKAFQFFLVCAAATMLVYTVLVGSTQGWNLFPLFFGDILAMNWAGQFNLDFSFFLAFSGLWVAWRNQFSATGISLGMFALVGGTPFICIYLLIKSAKVNNIEELLVGKK